MGEILQNYSVNMAQSHNQVREYYFYVFFISKSNESKNVLMRVCDNYNDFQISKVNKS